MFAWHNIVSRSHVIPRLQLFSHDFVSSSGSCGLRHDRRQQRRHQGEQYALQNHLRDSNMVLKREPEDAHLKQLDIQLVTLLDCLLLPTAELKTSTQG